MTRIRRRTLMVAAALVLSAIPTACLRQSPKAPETNQAVVPTVATQPQGGQPEGGQPEGGQTGGTVSAPVAHGTQAEAKAMLVKVASHLKDTDRATAFSEFTARKPPFFDHDLYVVCVDAGRVVVAHGGFPTYVGSSSFFKDAEGKVLGSTIWSAATNGNGTVRYTIRDDETNNILEHKIGFFRQIKHDVCGVVAHE